MGVLVDRVYSVTEGLDDDEQWGRGCHIKRCVDKIFILKKLGEKAKMKEKSAGKFYAQQGSTMACTENV